MAEILLSNIATVIRSKNAGPFLLTFDVLFDSYSSYAAVWDGGSITHENIASQFDLARSDVRSIFPVPKGHAIKITLSRPRPQGSHGESDMYGCQQHVPLMNMKVRLKEA